MFYKTLIFSMLSVFTMGKMTATSAHKLEKAINVVDSALFSSGLIAVSLANLKWYRSIPFDEILISGRFQNQFNMAIGVRIMIEAYRVATSLMQKDDKLPSKNNKSDAQQFIKLIDGLVMSAVFTQLGLSLLSVAYENSDINSSLALVVAALGARCLAHLHTTTKPLVEYLDN